MEESIGILMVDLSGYTALTETHGAASAADLIDNYVQIAQNCLVGDCKLHERTGDEIMIVSNSADSLLATTLLIVSHTSAKEYFLQLHGGLHFGNVLKRNGSYFGSAINLTSRIAAKASAGAFLCSDDFANSLSKRSDFPLESRGRHFFKNIIEEKELFEIKIGSESSPHIDPVCRMLILDIQGAIRHPIEEDLYFCSSQCLEKYTASQSI